MQENLTDKALLELAAKAADFTLQGKVYMEGNYFYGDGSRWAPLTDDGEAFRLAVKLHITVAPRPGLIESGSSDGIFWISAPLKSTDDPYAATRRAIVRAAAAIGQSR